MSAPRALNLKDMTLPQLHNLLRVLDQAIESRSQCSECEEPIDLVLRRDRVESEINSR